MSFTLAAAGSKGRLSLVAVETIERSGNRRDLYSVRFAQPLAQDAGPEEQYKALLEADAALRPFNGDQEPKIIVSYGGIGTTLFELLRDDFRRRQRSVRPFAIAYAGSGDSLAQPVSMNLLAAHLAIVIRNEQLAFAPGLDKLRKSIASFSPIESKAGNLQVDPADAYAPDQVALMHALARRGNGPRRYESVNGQIWQSRADAINHLGQGGV